MKFGFFVR